MSTPRNPTPGNGNGTGNGGNGAPVAPTLLDAFLDGEISAEQERELMVWLKAHPDNVKKFVRETHAHHALHELFAAQEAARQAGDIILEDAEPAARRTRTPLRQRAQVARRRSVRRGRWGAVAAIAAMAVLVAGVWLWQARYPTPAAQGNYVVAEGGALERGATVTAVGGPAALELGGYCTVQMDSGSAVRIDGAAKAEAVFLTQGRVDCAVDRNVGSFQVRTSMGDVSVTGTRFTVELRPQQGVEGMNKKVLAFALAVAVTAGSVKVDYDGQTYALQVGESRVFGADENQPPPPPPPPRFNNGNGNNVQPPAPPVARPTIPATPPTDNNGTDAGPTAPDAPNHPMPPPPPQGQEQGPGGSGAPGQMPPPPGPKGPPPPLMVALDANKDGKLSADEIANAAAALKKLDHNNDGVVDQFELRPVPPDGVKPMNPGQPGQGGQSGQPGQPGGPNGQGGAGGQGGQGGIAPNPGGRRPNMPQPRSMPDRAAPPAQPQQGMGVQP